jgi:tripartite-type tricarboxylate transporter receptor subunit TctC
MNMALFKQMAGIDMLQVTYQGDAPALAALVGGHVQLAFSNVVAALPHIQSGRLRAVAVATLNRTPSLADTPSIAESGLPGYESLLFYCMVAPSKVPASVVERLNALVTQIKQTPGAQQRLAGMGAVPFDMTLAAMKPFLESEIAKWTRVVKSAGIKPE